MILPFFLLAATAAAQPSIRMPIGITRGMTPIEALLTAEDLDYESHKTRILLVGGLDGDRGAAKAVREAFTWYLTNSRIRKYTVSAVPLANPEKIAIEGFPPNGEAYGKNPEAHYLWRWIGMHAPDLVVVIGPDMGLIDALQKNAPANTGTIPARTINATGKFMPSLIATLDREKFHGPSPARAAIQKRLARNPAEVARELAVHYGHDLNEAVYIPAVALIARIRMGETASVEEIVKPYYDGVKASLPEKLTASHLSGHLVFADLYEKTKKPRYQELVRAAAAKAVNHSIYTEMSDGVFMGCPILAKAGRFDEMVDLMNDMRKLCLRPDGLYRHSPLDEAAWGRGNGFPALGLVLSLGELPKSHPDSAPLLLAFQQHMATLAQHQDPTGMWHEVIDRPASYRELTATAMIAFAMMRGIRNGWLDQSSYLPHVQRAWYALRARIGHDGALVDVCTGTGKQKSVRDYLDRPAILGRDPRGGAMALLLAAELAAAN
jgi:unsaturated rhamnogalacturonyl hydrolase